jgi:hypothetical protein
MTPFQRQIFEAEKVREHNAEQDRMQAAQNGKMGGGGRTPNPAHPKVPSGGGSPGSRHSQSETVRYVNDNPDENPEANVTFVD